MTAQKREQLEAMNNLAAKGRAITLQEVLRKLDYSFYVSIVPRNLYKYEVVFFNRFDKFKATFYENGKGALILLCVILPEDNKPFA